MDVIRISTVLLGLTLLAVVVTAAWRRDRLELRARIFEVVGAATRRGLPLAPVLARMGTSLGSRRGAPLLALASALDAGEPFGAAIQRTLPSGTLPAETVATIVAADGTAALQEVLADLASATNSTQRAQDRIASALAYPTLLAIAMLGTFAATQSLLDELPIFAQAARPSSLVAANVVGVLLWTALAVVLAMRVGSFGGWVHRLFRSGIRGLPTIGRLFRLEASARVLRVAAGLSAAGLPLGEILRRAAHATRDPDVRSGVLHAARCADEGLPPVEVWQHTRLPDFAVAFASLACGGGPLAVAERLRGAALACERRLDRGVVRVVAWVQPTTIAVFGILIAMHFAFVVEHLQGARTLLPEGKPW